MNILAIDDNVLALEELVSSIKEACPVDDIHSFSKPSELLDYAKENVCDIAFLDIEMWGMNGIELAQKLKEINSKINIVFVTGYSKYALDSYTVKASDYVMKPVTKETVKEALENLRCPVKTEPDKRVRVQTFGNFEVFVDENPVLFTRSKTKELFAYLVSRKGALCSNNEVIAVIWEDKDDSPATQSHFRHLVADLIKTLKSLNVEDIIIRKWKQLAVVPGKLSCDFYEMLDGNVKAANSYAGEFMSQYSWAEIDAAYLENKCK
ncbi:MAG: response regulator [Spirochaetes bacterium]|nr:response regulator [Spirochaetota bacterium]